MTTTEFPTAPAVTCPWCHDVTAAGGCQACGGPPADVPTTICVRCDATIPADGRLPDPSGRATDAPSTAAALAADRPAVSQATIDQLLVEAPTVDVLAASWATITIDDTDRDALGRWITSTIYLPVLGDRLAALLRLHPQVTTATARQLAATGRGAADVTSEDLADVGIAPGAHADILRWIADLPEPQNPEPALRQLAPNRCRRCATTAIRSRKPRCTASAALTGTCACSTCTDRLTEVRSWVHRRCAGESLADIAATVDLTRERIRQLCDQAAPHRPWEAIRTEEAAVTADIPAAPARTCPVCGTAVTGRTYCSDTHRLGFYSLRWHIDEAYRETHRGRIARWVADHPDDTEAFQQRHAANVLAGTTVDKGTQWVIKDSAAWTLIAEAISGDWPLLALLPDRLIDQVTTDLSEREETFMCA